MKMLLDERKKRILEAVIEEYNATAEPVGSTKIANDYNLGFSSATIRNEMANLEELGYLEQPHVSAGRIPSSMGYRFYVDSIMKEKNLTPSEKQIIDAVLKEDIIKFETLIKEASNIIARLTIINLFWPIFTNFISSTLQLSICGPIAIEA